MSEYSKFNLVYRLQRWMDSVPGQTFLNYAYSWGASIVILGTLFKLTHLPGANFMLFLGMGTEVVVFFLSAFDRPFDKTADGRELPTHLGKRAEEDVEETEGADEYHVDADVETLDGEARPAAAIGGGTIIIGGAPSSGTAAVSPAEEAEGEGLQGVPAGGVAIGGGAVGGAAWLGQQAESTPEMIEAQGDYVENLKKLNETLAKVEEQSQRLTRDSEEMENLNRTLTGISKVYEMQLKGASAQIGTIDEINEQTRKLAQQIAELNKIYARMIEAMTVNMPAAAAGLAVKSEE
ncbi:MAG: gliding motility protein GldL [Prevotella sp.]|nr:gliding motility protein GldL [Prevotella sp.]